MLTPDLSIVYDYRGLNLNRNRGINSIDVVVPVNYETAKYHKAKIIENVRK